MGEDLYRHAAEDDRGDAMAAVRSHGYQIAALRPRSIDDRLVRMLVLNLDRLACDAGCLRCAGGSAKGFLGVLLHAYLVLSRRVLDHLRVDCERMKGRQDCQHGGFGTDPLGQGDAMLDSFSGQFRTVRWYQDVRIHRYLLDYRLLEYRLLEPADCGTSTQNFLASCARMERDIGHRFAPEFFQPL